MQNYIIVYEDTYSFNKSIIIQSHNENEALKLFFNYCGIKINNNLTIQQNYDFMSNLSVDILIKILNGNGYIIKRFGEFNSIIKTAIDIKKSEDNNND